MLTKTSYPVRMNSGVSVTMEGGENESGDVVRSVAIFDGRDESQGAMADAPATTATTAPWSVVSLLKGIFATLMARMPTLSSGNVPVSGPVTDIQLRATAVPVSMTSTTISNNVAVGVLNFPATQPISIASPVAVTGSFFQTTQPVSMSSIPALATGTNLIGKCGFDETTPGTTNLVAVISGQNGVAAGAGASSANTQRVIHASDDPLAVSVGGKTDAASTLFDTTASSCIALYKAMSAFLKTIATGISGRGTYTIISTNSTTVVRNGPTYFKRLVVVNAGALLNTIAIYDNTTATGTALYTTTTLLSLNGPLSIEMGFNCLTGLTVVMATGTAARIIVITDG